MKKTLASLIFATIVAGSTAAQAATILVGTDAGLAPFEFKDQKSEEIVGFDMDIIKAVAKAVGDEAKIQNMQFAGIIPALQTNMIDVAVAAITITEERKKQVLFSDPYYDVGLAMVIKAANKDKYSELKDIEGKAICAQIGSTGSLLAQSVKGAKVMNFDQVAEALMELKMGGCEAAKYIREMDRPDAKQVPMIAVTANAFSEDIAATTAAGMDAHISKPIYFNILCATMQDLLQQREK